MLHSGNDDDDDDGPILYRDDDDEEIEDEGKQNKSPRVDNFTGFLKLS